MATKVLLGVRFLIPRRWLLELVDDSVSSWPDVPITITMDDSRDTK